MKICEYFLNFFEFHRNEWEPFIDSVCSFFFLWTSVYSVCSTTDRQTPFFLNLRYNSLFFLVLISTLLFYLFIIFFVSMLQISSSFLQSDDSSTASLTEFFQYVMTEEYWNLCSIRSMMRSSDKLFVEILSISLFIFSLSLSFVVFSPPLFFPFRIFLNLFVSSRMLNDLILDRFDNAWNRALSTESRKFLDLALRVYNLLPVPRGKKHHEPIFSSIRFPLLLFSVFMRLLDFIISLSRPSILSLNPSTFFGCFDILFWLKMIKYIVFSNFFCCSPIGLCEYISESTVLKLYSSFSLEQPVQDCSMFFNVSANFFFSFSIFLFLTCRYDILLQAPFSW